MAKDAVTFIRGHRGRSLIYRLVQLVWRSDWLHRRTSDPGSGQYSRQQSIGVTGRRRFIGGTFLRVYWQGLPASPWAGLRFEAWTESSIDGHRYGVRPAGHFRAEGQPAPLGCMSYGDPSTVGGHEWSSTTRKLSRSSDRPWSWGSPFGTQRRLPGRDVGGVVGRAISGMRADDLVLATKCTARCTTVPAGKAYLARRSLAGRLLAPSARHRLHRPVPNSPLRPNTPVEETMEALHYIVRAGKVRYIGASSMYAWQSPSCSMPPTGQVDTVRVDAKSVQLAAPRGRAGADGDVCRYGVGLVPSPRKARAVWLGRGVSRRALHVDKVVKSFDRPLDEPVVNAVERIAEARDVTMAQMLWHGAD